MTNRYSRITDNNFDYPFHQTVPNRFVCRNDLCAARSASYFCSIHQRQGIVTETSSLCYKRASQGSGCAQLVEQLLQTRGTRSIPVIGKIYTYRKCVYCQLFEKAKIMKKMPGMDIFKKKSVEAKLSLKLTSP